MQHLLQPMVVDGRDLESRGGKDRIARELAGDEIDGRSVVLRGKR